MASAISTPTSSLCSPSSSTFTSKRPTLCILSKSLISIQKNPDFHLSKSISQLGFGPFSQWNGLRQHSISVSQFSVRIARKGKCKGKGVFASLFGVGAPEALVIGVVALLVFGPKGLAEVARNLGKTLRAFQPTIRELQEVSREFKSTLEKEIGLDDLQSPLQNTSDSDIRKSTTAPPSDSTSKEPQVQGDPNGTPSTAGAYTSEEYLKITEEQLKAVEAQQQIETKAETDSAASPAETVIQSNDDDPPPADGAYLSKEYLNFSQEQRKATAVQQLEEAASTDNVESEPATKSQDGIPPSERDLSKYIELTKSQMKASAAEQQVEAASPGDNQAEPVTPSQG